MTLTVDRNLITEPLAEIKIGSVEIEPRSSFQKSVGTYTVGKFDREDLKVFRTSLRNSISSLQASVQTDRHNKIVLYVLIRHYMVANNSIESGAPAAVAWCLTNEEGAVTFHEGFFASETSRHTTSLGSVKNVVNESILRRILDTVAQLASSKKQQNIVARLVPKTYRTYKEALIELPETLSSVINFDPTVGPLDWGWPSGDPVDIDWSQHLSDKANRRSG